VAEGERLEGEDGGREKREEGFVTIKLNCFESENCSSENKNILKTSIIHVVHPKIINIYEIKNRNYDFYGWNSSLHSAALCRTG